MWGVSRAIPLACTVRVLMTVQPLVFNEVGEVCRNRGNSLLSHKCRIRASTAGHAEMERAS